MITELQLELTNLCNSRCVMCPRDQLKRSLGFMKKDFAIQIIDQAVELGVRTVKAQWFGESLLHPNYLDIIAYLKKKGLKIIVTTNGFLLNEEIADRLLHFGVERINFSIDAANLKDYEAIRLGLKFKIVQKNLKYLFKKREELHVKTKIQVDCVKHERFNASEMRRTFAGICDNIVFNNLLNTSKNNGSCLHKVGERLIVGWNGKCYLCCHDWLGHYEIGDLKQEDMAEIWNGERRLNYLKNLKNLEICKFC